MKSIITLIFLLCAFACFGQAIYKKGYVVNTEKDTIQGFVLIDKAKLYHEKVTFKISRKQKSETFGINDILAFGFGRKNKYEVNNVAIDDTAKTKFLRIIAKQELVTIYVLEVSRDKYFFLKNAQGELKPLETKKILVEEYKIASGKYKLPDGEILTFQGDVKEVTSKKGEVFEYKNGKLYQVKYIFRETIIKDLGIVADCITKEDLKNIQLKERSLLKYNFKLGSCRKTRFKNFDRGFQLQASLLAVGTTHSSVRNNVSGYGLGLMANLRSNLISPNLSLSFSYFEYDDLSVLRTNKLSPDIDNKIKIVTTTTRYNPYSVALGLNYHFLPAKNIRPFISAEVKQYYYYGRPISFTTDDVNYDYTPDPINSVQFSTGLDCYFLKVAKLHLAAGYSGVFYYNIGFGFFIK